MNNGKNATSIEGSTLQLSTKSLPSGRFGGGFDSTYMRRCLQLARNGQQNAQPNPMVGAVVVCEGRIIGEGYHVRCGEGHAEVNALASVKKEDEHLLKDATIYVSLEPCSHYGKTPPCADLIISKGLKRCVVGCVDPFAKVQGRGIQKLRDAGIEVTVGVLEEECKNLNKRFMTFHRLKRPFISLKWAKTKDGVIGLKSEERRAKHENLLISNTYTQMLCHKRRAEHQAILVGRRTLEMDAPSLNVRAWKGWSSESHQACLNGRVVTDFDKVKGKNPQPIVLGKNVKDLPEGWWCFETIEETLSALYERGIQTLLVEGGRETLQAFIDKDVWDEAYVEIGDFSWAEMNREEGVEAVFAPTLKNAERVEDAWFMGHQIEQWRHLS